MSACGVDCGGEEVHGEGLEIRGAGLDHSRPDRAGGNLDAAFIHVLFFTAQVPATGPDVDLPAVVGDEDCQGLFPLAGFFEGGDDLADAVVHVLDEGDEPGAFFGDPFFALLHFGEPVGGGLDGGVRGVVGEVEEEGLGVALAGVRGEVVVGPIGEEIGGVALGLDRFSVEAHVVLLVAAVVVIVVHHVAEEAVEVVESAGVGVLRGLQSEVPFADRGGGVALRLEHLREHGGGAREEAPVFCGLGPDDSGDADEIGVASGKKGGAGGGAHGAVGVEFGEAHPIGHEGVEVRTLEIGRAVAGEVAVAEIIDDNEEDVGPFGGEGELDEKEEEDDQTHECNDAVLSAGSQLNRV